MTMASKLLARVPPLFNDLANTIAGDISCSLEVMSQYSQDKSPYRVLPQAVVSPKNAQDIKHVLSFAHEYAMPVTVRGSGGGSVGGALGEGIILDMSRYYSVVRAVNVLENTVTVDAGTTVRALLEKLHSWGVDIPILTYEDDTTTLGALVATKSSSPSSFCHGTIREWVEGITVVVDTGEEHHITDGISPSGRLLGIYQSVFPILIRENPILRAHKPSSFDDATGYNLWSTQVGPRQLIDQIVGSEGTLSIITSVTLRVTPYKPYRITSCIPITDKKLLPLCIEEAKKSGAEHLYLYDETCMQLAERYAPLVVPFFIDTPYVLLVTHAGFGKDAVRTMSYAYTSTIPIEHYTIKTIEDDSILQRIHDRNFWFSLYENYTRGALLPVNQGEGLVVTLAQLPLLLEQLEEYLNTLGRFYTITGNVGSGVVTVTTLFDTKSLSYSKELLEYSKNLFSIIKNYRGGISAIGGEGMARTPFLSYVYNDAVLTIFKTIKDAWDPRAILNPGKKVSGTLAYLEKHLKR